MDKETEQKYVSNLRVHPSNEKDLYELRMKMFQERNDSILAQELQIKESLNTNINHNFNSQSIAANIQIKVKNDSSSSSVPLEEKPNIIGVFKESRQEMVNKLLQEKEQKDVKQKVRENPSGYNITRDSETSDFLKKRLNQSIKRQNIRPRIEKLPDPKENYNGFKLILPNRWFSIRGVPLKKNYVNIYKKEDEYMMICSNFMDAEIIINRRGEIMRNVSKVKIEIKYYN